MLDQHASLDNYLSEASPHFSETKSPAVQRLIYCSSYQSHSWGEVYKTFKYVAMKFKLEGEVDDAQGVETNLDVLYRSDSLTDSKLAI